MTPSRTTKLFALARALTVAVTFSLLTTYAVERVVPWYKKRRNLQKNKHALKGTRLQAANLTLHESIVASQVVDTEEIEEGFDSIGGHDNLIQEIARVTTLPLKLDRTAQASSLFTPTRGVLLYGPPGTGKTMLARAVAKESGLSFVNLDFGQVMSKYVGESEKLISAVFSLASKLAPSMIFIDEIDCYMRSRSSSDHEYTAQMKAQFMSCWDGFSRRSDVIVIAASNRPDAIDPAILRRLPCKFEVDLPNQEQRAEILTKILRGERLDGDIDYRELARGTRGFSGDDLQQMCKMAAMSTIHDSDNETTMRPMRMDDLKEARNRIIPSSGVEVDPDQFYDAVRRSMK